MVVVQCAAYLRPLDYPGRLVCTIQSGAKKQMGTPCKYSVTIWMYLKSTAERSKLGVEVTNSL